MVSTLVSTVSEGLETIAAVRSAEVRTYFGLTWPRRVVDIVAARALFASLSNREFTNQIQIINADAVASGVSF